MDESSGTSPRGVLWDLPDQSPAEFLELLPFLARRGEFEHLDVQLRQAIGDGLAIVHTRRLEARTQVRRLDLAQLEPLEVLAEAVLGVLGAREARGRCQREAARQDGPSPPVHTSS